MTEVSYATFQKGPQSNHLKILISAWNGGGGGGGGGGGAM